MKTHKVIRSLVVLAISCAMSTWILNAIHLWTGRQSIFIKLAGNALIFLLLFITAMPFILNRISVSDVHLIAQHQSLLSTFILISGSLATLTAPITEFKGGWIESINQNDLPVAITLILFLVLAMVGNTILGLTAKRSLSSGSEQWSYLMMREKSLRKDIRIGKTARKLLSKIDGRDLAFLIPAFNEEETVGRLVQTLRKKYPKSRILVVNNNSRDKTADLAKDSGAIVITERRQGKSYAFQKGIAFLQKSDPNATVIMLDADHTYLPQDAALLIAHLEASGADIVVGSRLRGVREAGAISSINLLGNHLFSFIARTLYGSSVADICSGYWAYSPRAMKTIASMNLKSGGFALEAELTARCTLSGMIISEVPIRYARRETGSSHLKAFHDGLQILCMLLRLSTSISLDKRITHRRKSRKILINSTSATFSELNKKLNDQKVHPLI